MDNNSGSGGTGTADLASAVEISGSVGDGPVTGATIVVYTARGDELGTMTSDSTASFQSTIRAKGRDYPLIIKATGGFDLVTGAAPSFEMLTVMLSPSEKQQNINPFTTLIVKTAQSLPGGLSANNVKTAWTTVMDKLGFGLDPNLIPDPIATPIDATRAGNIIKASEVLAEMVRRTASTVSGAGGQVSGDGVLAALAADLTDGYLDGRGARGADARIAAVAEVVSAQVLVEALRNELKVEGVVATGALDAAIRTTQPGISASQLTSGVRIPAGMLEQAQVALAAVRVLDTSSQVADIATSVGSIAPNALPGDVVKMLSADATTYLENAVVLSSRATSQQMTSIGQVVRDGSVSTGGGTGGTGGTGSTSGSGSSGSTSTGAVNNLALGMPVVVSSEEGAGTIASYAVDGDASSRWSSQYSDPQSIYVDLGETYAIERVVLRWETAYGKAYEIQVSPDGRNWVTVFGESNGNGNIDDISIAPINGRYVRMLGQQRGTAWGYSLWEMEVYGAAASSQGTNTSGGSSGTSSGTSSTSSSGGTTTSSGSTTGSGTTGSVSNNAPVISGSPAGSVVAGSTYSFQPSASDADGNALSFSISNKPAWANFSSSTGRLSGTPGTGSVGSYGNIVISVSDGTASASLPAFGIQVAAPPAQASGSITLRWKAPVARADGTPLSLADIDGYRIHYGKSAGNYTNHVDVPDGTAQSVTLTDIPPGTTYYLAMSSYDVDGRESGYSAVVSKNVQ